jgi:hypothetical protein
MIPNQVYHLVEAANWPSVQRHGLLSTLELLRLTGISPAARQQISTTQRLRRTVLSDQVAIRDQAPMPADALQKCLIGMTPAQWYSLLNGMVFFWCDRVRLNRQLGACGGLPQIVLTRPSRPACRAHALQHGQCAPQASDSGAGDVRAVCDLARVGLAFGSRGHGRP